MDGQREHMNNMTVWMASSSIIIPTWPLAVNNSIMVFKAVRRSVATHPLPDA